MLERLKNQSPARIIAVGFAVVILLGSCLLSLPWSVKEGVRLSYIDALYTSTSAVCVTGLIVVDAGDTFTGFGQFVLMMLIQTGGLGVTAVGAGVILAMGRHINLKGRSLIREASNLSTAEGNIRFLKSVFLTTVTIELIGALLSFFVFVQDYPPARALWISLFHSVAAFNNSGFDLLGNFQNLIPYRSNVALNLITCGLIFLGGIGFLVIREVRDKRWRWRALSMHAKVVLSVSAALITGGAVLLRCTEKIGWLEAFFHSVSARTAGFSTMALGEWSQAGLLVMTALMFIGASPGSTGGGIKTSTFFVLIEGIHSAATNRTEKAFRYSLPADAFHKASVITLLAGALVFSATTALLCMEPELRVIDALFEMTSAFGTVGLSTGITTSLGVDAKLLTVVMMYIGRLGPLTVATLWAFTKGERVRYPEGNIAIG